MTPDPIRPVPINLSRNERLAYLVQISSGIIASALPLHSPSSGLPVQISDGDYYARAVILVAENILVHLVNRIENS